MSELIPKGDGTDRLPNEGPLIQVGQWYWTQSKDGGNWDDFGCVTYIGSNYVEIVTPSKYNSSKRIHLNEFEKKAKRELDPDAVIKGRLNQHQGEVQHKLTQIKELTARLGVDPKSSTAPVSESRELSTFNAMPDLSVYKKSLIKAKDKELPKLFKEMEEAHEKLAIWMQAPTIPLKAMSSSLEDCIEKIDARVFNVSIYAGLSEDVEQVADGAPANAGEKLHLFQRMHYMDEECLAQYRHGGMEFGDIEDFDAWLTEPGNLNRILPYARSAVAFRVRRNRKYREWDGSLSQAFVVMRLEEADKTTFLYIRNGDKVFRIESKLEFGEHLFPSAHQVDFSRPMMAKHNIRSLEDIVSKDDYEIEMRKWEEGVKNQKQWLKENKGKNSFESPFRKYDWSNPWREYEPFNKSSVYYDDMEAEVAKQITYYNRIAVILQGLFDRSEILHPHPPARLWTSEGMRDMVELVYDGASALHYGEAPKWEDYLAKVNSSISRGSLTIGQEEAWERRSADYEWARRSWRDTRQNKPERVRPDGDPGPGYISEVKAWSGNKRLATFRWTRERRSYDRWGQHGNGLLNCAITVPVDKLFNVSGYKPGDFKLFYSDPRTRAEYLEWAPFLISAEEYHAGNLDPYTGKLKERLRKRRK
jgi:hypothetical protein